MSASYELAATAREKVGKGAARATRREGLVPAVIYGGKQPSLAISLADKELDLKVRAGGFFTTLATINVGDEKVRVVPRDYQLDPISDRLVHVDFMRVVPGSRLTVDVPVHFANEGASPGIKRGGVLNIVRHTIAVTCPAEAIPEEIVCDLTDLDINDSLHISAITLPEGVKPTITRNFTIATIAAPAGVKEEMRALADAAAAAKTAAEAVEGTEGEAAPAAAGEGEQKADAKKE
jgi:large subunit ribosomal protein L25